MTNVLFNFNFNLIIAISCVTSFLFNVLILRLRKVYLPLNWKHLMWLMLIPCMNVVMLSMNIIICCMNIGCYSVKKKRMTKSTYKYYKNRVSKRSAQYTVKSN